MGHTISNLSGQDLQWPDTTQGLEKITLIFAKIRHFTLLRPTYDDFNSNIIQRPNIPSSSFFKSAIPLESS